MGTENVAMWERIYAAGELLWYPYDIVIRLIRHHAAREGFSGVILDHGCGSGNHLEFFARMGLNAHGTDVSKSALDTVRSRFAGAKLPLPPLTLLDLNEPLGTQLPHFQHVFAWGSMHYNFKQTLLSHLATLIDLLPTGGTFIFSIPSMRDVAAEKSELLPDGSRRMAQDVSQQKGAIITVPSSRDELLSWLTGVQVRDCDMFGWSIRGIRSEYYFVYGVKAP